MSGRQCPGPARPSPQQQPSPHSLSAALPFTAAPIGAQGSRPTDGEEWEHAAQEGSSTKGHAGAF
eukprot:1141902-Pelagomonas_calceolata.AAC.1